MSWRLIRAQVENTRTDPDIMSSRWSENVIREMKIGTHEGIKTQIEDII